MKLFNSRHFLCFLSDLDPISGNKSAIINRNQQENKTEQFTTTSAGSILGARMKF
jgi:hypothetical protein